MALAGDSPNMAEVAQCGNVGVSSSVSLVGQTMHLHAQGREIRVDSPGHHPLHLWNFSTAAEPIIPQFNSLKKKIFVSQLLWFRNSGATKLSDSGSVSLKILTRPVVS